MPAVRVPTSGPTRPSLWPGHVAMKPGKRKVLEKMTAIKRLRDQFEKFSASVCAKVEHLFRVINR